MASPLPFRNLEGQDSDKSQGRDGWSDNDKIQYSSDSYDTNDSNNNGSNLGRRRKRRQSRRSDGRREDREVENLLVSSTISRDTTKNTPAADLVDLSKLAALADDLPLNMRDTIRPIVMKITGDEEAVKRKKGASYAGSLADGENYPPPPGPGPGPAPGPAPVDVGRPIPPPPAFPPGMQPPAPTFHPNSILGKIMPGSNMPTLYAGLRSNQANSASYNWRNKLRITGRRKSESDLYGKLDHDSWVSQHLPPTASMRQLVHGWKMTRFDIKKTRPGGLAPKDNDEGELGATLGRTAEKYLGLDLYDNTPQSMFFSYLLDAMEAIRTERNFLLDLLTKPQEFRPLPPPSLTPQPTEPNSTAVLTPKVKILHRVFCKSHLHHHDQFVFEDIPVRRFSNRSQDLELAGEKLVGNFNFYLSQNPAISFIIFKEYICFEDPHNFQRKERKGLSGELSPRAERLSIVSPLLQNALDQVALFPEPEARQRHHGVREMAAPYLFLYHHRELLSKFKAEASGPTKENMALLLSFLESNYGVEYREADMEFSKGILTNKHIEKLFRPNDIIIEKSDGRDMAYVMTDWPQINEHGIRVSCWSWHYDGSSLERSQQSLRLSLPLPDNCTKDKLSFYPMSIATDATIEKLRKRGKKFWSMKDKYFGCFSGLDESKIQHHHTRVVVDTSTYSRMHDDRTGRSVSENSRFDPWPKTISRDKEPDDSMIMLLPPTVYGFMLQEKKWLKLDIHGIHPIEWNKRAFDRLVLNPKTKELIRALVEIRIAAGRAEDIIGGKGNGLMILLHGGPGTGKTLTAESVAEIAEKPLYRVTCGDIGTKADDVEKYLQTVLYLGKIWNCVLLLDEADIFLEERTIADLERNSLVSVFLRILEYYDGILIMTSNRVGTFDEAFKSRIQVSLHYEDLSKKSRKTIWSNFIAMLEEREEDVDVSDLESHLDELASEEINGRQIRNAMTTARQLALHRHEKLQWEHLEQALRTAREFNQYLKKVQGHTDKQWAREQRLR